MAITRFFYILLVFSFIFLFYSKDTKPVEMKKEEKATVIFENSVMYEIDTQKVKQVIQSQKANIFKDYEELYNATVIAKSKDDIDRSSSLSADHIVKIKDDIFLNGNVHFQSYNDVVFKSEQLHYNTKNDIAKNDTKFEATKKNSRFEGENLYYDSKINQIVAKNTHFKIDLEDNK